MSIYSEKEDFWENWYDTCSMATEAAVFPSQGSSSEAVAAPRWQQRTQQFTLHLAIHDSRTAGLHHWGFMVS